MPTFEANRSQVSLYEPFFNLQASCTQGCPQKLGNRISGHLHSIDSGGRLNFKQAVEKGCQRPWTVAREARDMRENHDPKFEVQGSKFRKPRTSDLDPSPISRVTHTRSFLVPEGQDDFSGGKRYSLRQISTSHIVSAGTRKGIHEFNTRHDRNTSI